MTRKLLILSSILLAIAVVVAIAGALATGAVYRDRIYPGVTVAGRDLGGLSLEEAAPRVEAVLPQPDAQALTVRAGDASLQITWAMAGQTYDVDAALETAYAMGRERAWWLGALNVIQATEIAVEAPLIPADPAAVHGYVTQLADQVAVAPQDATLTIGNGQVIATEAVAGRRLDVEEATARIVTALAEGASELTLTPAPVAPRLTALDPARSRAQALLAEPFILVVDDPLTNGREAEEGEVAPTGYYAELAAAPTEVAAWLRIRPQDDAFVMDVDRASVRAWVKGVAPQVGELRDLDVAATLDRILAALAEARHRADARVTHPTLSYVVEAGDTFFDIAYNHGFPQYQLEKANPDVDPGLIDVGQVLTIPSLDVLFPHPLVRDKRIEIHLPTQTLTAYENDAVVFEFKASSGISSTPTLAGQFQILFKEEMAFAERWALDMPYFMGFYEERDGFYNGIHELPITAYGRQLSSGVLGWPASYGCIILDEGDAQALYDWAEVGTYVRVIGVAPGTPTWQEILADIAPLVEEGGEP